LPRCCSSARLRASMRAASAAMRAWAWSSRADSWPRSSWVGSGFGSSGRHCGLCPVCAVCPVGIVYPVRIICLASIRNIAITAVLEEDVLQLLCVKALLRKHRQALRAEGRNDSTQAVEDEFRQERHKLESVHHTVMHREREVLQNLIPLDLGDLQTKSLEIAPRKSTPMHFMLGVVTKISRYACCSRLRIWLTLEHDLAQVLLS